MSETTVLEQLQIGTELAELCRTHAIDHEWLESSPDLDALVGRVLQDCDVRLGRLPGRQAEAESGQPEAAELHRLKTLVAFARRASELRDRADDVPRVVTGIEDLERLSAGSSGRSAGEPSAEQSRAKMTELLGAISTLCHKINNPLTSLLGRAQVLQMKPDTDPRVCKGVQVIEESARRVAGLVQELSQVVCQGKEELLTK